MSNQLEWVREIIDRYSLDAVLVSCPYNLRYVSGFSGGEGYLYISRKQAVLLTDFRYTIQAEEEAAGFVVKEISKSYPEEIYALTNQDGIEKMGFEGGHLIYQDYAKIEQALPNVRLFDLGDLITGLRRIKEDWEIDRIARAEAIGDKAFEDILGFLKPGMTELQVAARLEYTMKQLGAEKLSFDTIVASGIHSSMPHASPTEKVLEMGDFVTMDFGCVYQGYCSDMTRTVVIGKAGEEQKKLYNTVLQAQQAALDFIHAGYTGKEIDQVARNVIYSAGYEGMFGHGLGHSVGLFIHENPRFSPSENSVIEKNQVITVEPGIYKKGFGGVRIEDLVVVKENGCVNLTKSEKKLIEI
ncbi:MAG: aminopeptidase P family protein [Clostridiales bacterium]|nr:aminopeptidase P family protein [Clostridiales bacterium]